VHAPELLARQRVDEQRHEHGGQELAQRVGRDQRDHPGTREGGDEARDGGGQHGLPADLHAPRVLRRGHPRAPDGGALVRAQQIARDGGGEGGEQRRHENESSATDDRIDKTGQQRGQRNDDGIHRADFRTGRTKKKHPPGGCLCQKYGASSWAPHHLVLFL